MRAQGSDCRITACTPGRIVELIIGRFCRYKVFLVIRIGSCQRIDESSGITGLICFLCQKYNNIIRVSFKDKAAGRCGSAGNRLGIVNRIHHRVASCKRIGNSSPGVFKRIGRAIFLIRIIGHCLCVGSCICAQFCINCIRLYNVDLAQGCALVGDAVGQCQIKSACTGRLDTYCNPKVLCRRIFQALGILIEVIHRRAGAELVGIRSSLITPIGITGVIGSLNSGSLCADCRVLPLILVKLVHNRIRCCTIAGILCCKHSRHSKANQRTNRHQHCHNLFCVLFHK